ncbi:SdpI family protein [Microbacterium sp. Se63.02b]|nr:SdpI family protein [Microbacterium sp. Se63.02b]
MEIAGAGVMVLFGAALLWWARASRRGTFPRQRILGYRTSRTLRDGDAWVSAHRAMAPLLFVAGGGSSWPHSPPRPRSWSGTRMSVEYCSAAQSCGGWS